MALNLTNDLPNNTIVSSLFVYVLIDLKAKEFYLFIKTLYYLLFNGTVFEFNLTEVKVIGIYICF